MRIESINNIRNINFKNNEITSTKNKDSKKISFSLPKFNINLLQPKYQKRYLYFLEGMNSDGQEMTDLVEKYARKYVVYDNAKLKTAKITKEHCYLAFLDSIYTFANKIINNRAEYSQDGTNTAKFAKECSNQWIWTKENTPQTAEIIMEEYKNVQNELIKKSSHNSFVSSLYIDEDFMKDINDMINEEMNNLGTYDIENINSDSASYMKAILSSTNSKTHTFASKILKFFHKLSLVATTDKTSSKAAIMPYYQNIALKAIKNADRNFNLYIVNSDDDENAPEYFVNNLVEQLNNIDDKEYKNLKKNNIKMIVFNRYADLDTISEECKKYKNDTNTNYFVIIKDFNKTFYNSLVASENGSPIIRYDYIDNSIGLKSKNIHFILLNNQSDYYRLLNEPIVEKEVRNFQNLQIPIIDSATLSDQIVYTKDYIKEQINADIDDDALKYIATLPINSKGSKYDNAIKFIKNIATYYTDSKKITKDMATSYWENTFKTDMAMNENPYDMLLNIDKNLDSITGTPMVKKQAEKIVYELKNFPKTKGYILYNDQGSIGGRMNCAKAIAGELKIPMICINAADFAMRDIDTVNQDPIKAIELKMGMLVNLLKTQAQANQNKMVMLYISNFDNFAANSLYGFGSIYEQQAFQKLLKEMKKSQNDKDYNIVVMGASDNPECTREDILRPGLFIDDIIIYPPKTPENYIEIAKNHIKDKNYKLSDEEKTLSHFAKIMKGIGAAYVSAIDILDSANILAHKRNSDSIAIEDINESYLSKTSGEVSNGNITDRAKDVIIRHEGAHALNLQFMYNLFKEQGDNIRIGNSIMNIALDPRGNYLGCVQDASSYENTTEANMETVMSDLVCDFGGNSSEELFFNMAGSWGISKDMMQANNMAKSAVLYMGLGARMKHFIPDIDPHSGNPKLYSTDEENYSKDVKTLLENSKIISDKIVKCYADFLKEFSQKNISKFGTGNCIITGDDFANSLKEWENKQPDKKKQEISRLKKEVLAIIEYTKKGIIYEGIVKINPLYRFF